MQQEYKMLLPCNKSGYYTLVIYYNHRHKYLKLHKGWCKSNSNWFRTSDKILLEDDLNK